MRNARGRISSPPVLAATGSEPAGGAAVGQILIANAMAITASGALAWLVLGHRSGRVPYLGRAAAAAERASGLPGWAALPSATASASLLVALLGMYWDISLHIDVGRDAGPLANPAHYLILAGLFGIFCSGFVAMALPLERPGPTAVRINRGWYAPLGGVLITACAFFSLLGFPLDDLWHRLFGQDVTLWGPTHLMLIGGAALTLVGQAVLLVEGMRARERTGAGASPALIVRLRRAGLMGGLLVGLSTFQAEFDFGVPQFQMVFQPVLIALAAGDGAGLRPDLDRAGGRFRDSRLLPAHPRGGQPDRRRRLRRERSPTCRSTWPRRPASRLPGSSSPDGRWRFAAASGVAIGTRRLRRRVRLEPGGACRCPGRLRCFRRRRCWR